ncbi:hypothetical protein [Streptomyces sp. NPDC093261]|uniref:hypothetical protein n=1 Tax=Streptomyces sp. NPDC093261 TaxID=3366037 RepID=UPI003820511A
MTFEVRPEDLDGYSRQVGRAAEDMNQAQQYIKKYGDMGALTGQGLFMWATGMHSQAMDGVNDVVARLHALLVASAKELSKSAAYYRATDRDQASKLDGTYPSSKR